MPVNATELRDDILAGIEDATGNVPAAIAQAIWEAVAAAIAENVNGTDLPADIYSGLDCVPNNGTLGGNYDYNLDEGSFDQIGNTNAALLPLKVAFGQTISEIHARVDPAAAASISIQLFRTSSSGGNAVAVTGEVFSSGTAVQTLPLTGIGETVDDLTASYFVKFAMSVVSTGNKIFAIAVQP
jgi:hypothetical protein